MDSRVLHNEHAQNHEPSLDQENLLFMVQSTVSVQSLDKINRILREVELLNDVERLILYLRLPGSEEVPADPLRGPLNPLGSRSELQQTLAWIRTHLEPDSEVSLPKQDVYEEYMVYCSTNGVKHLSTADFGKIMKQAFPGVKPRRLGVRGQSRYCYAGLKKKLKLENPKLPEPESSPENPSRMPVARWATEELDALDQLSVCSVLGWAGGMFGRKFQTISALAEHIAVMPENGKPDNMESEPDSVSPNPKPATPGGRGGKRKCPNAAENRRGRGGKRGRPPNVKLEGRTCSEARSGTEHSFAGSSQGFVDPSLLHIKRDVCDTEDRDHDAVCSDPLLSDATDPSLQIQHENMQTSQESVASNHAASPLCPVPFAQGENHTGSTDSDVMMGLGGPKLDQHSNASQLSQLRILLEHNLSTAEEEVQSNSKHVSFVEDEVPSSPNTRRRAFDFTPISPRHTPVASPFVSPRQTPVHMRNQCNESNGEQFLSPAGRSRHSSASSLLLQQRTRPVSSMAQPYPRSAPMSPLVHNECRNRGLPPCDPRRRHMSAGIVGLNPRFIGDMPFSDLGMDAQSRLPLLLRSQSVPLQQMMCGDPGSTPSTPVGCTPLHFPPSPWMENPGMTPTPVPSECYDFGPDAIDADSLHSIISEVYASGQLEFAESVLDAASSVNISNQTMNPLSGSLQPSDDVRQRSDAAQQCNPDPQTSKFLFL